MFFASGSQPALSPKTVPPVSTLTPDLLSLEGVRKISPCPRGKTLFCAGDKADEVFYIETGLTKVCVEGAEGRELIVGILTGGDLLGEESFLGSDTRQTSAEMLAEGTVYAIPAAAMTAFLKRRPEAWETLCGFLDARKRTLERKLDLLFLRDVEQRILRTLEELSSIFGAKEDGSVDIRLSQSEIASLIGATRETTSTTLNVMERRGVISLGRRLVSVSSMESLRTAIQMAAFPAVGGSDSAAAAHGS